MLKLTLFESRGGSLIPLSNASGRRLGPFVIDSLEIEYPFADIEALIEFIGFMEEFRVEHRVPRSLLPRLYHQGRHISSNRCVERITAMLSGDASESPVRLRFIISSAFSKPLVRAYLPVLEHRAKVAEEEAAEAYHLHMRHPLFSPAENFEAHSRIQTREKLLDFYRTLADAHFPELGKMH